MGRKYLLDTQVLIWALTEPERLPLAVRQTIEDRRHLLFVSAASAWEIATKWRLGRLRGVEAVIAGFPRHLQRLGAEELPITIEHSLLAGRLPAPHRDPFDRMLAAQALIEGMILITGDPAFHMFGVETLW
jgi:PIN domain nuclease of toxin-antitoxin system